MWRSLDLTLLHRTGMGQWKIKIYQVMKVYSRKIIMKQKVLIFASIPELDLKIVEELDKMGIESKITRDLGNFHWLITTILFDAIIFDTQFFIDKCAKPLAILDRFRSYHTIIEYSPYSKDQDSPIQFHQLEKTKITKKHPINPDKNISLISEAILQAISSYQFVTKELKLKNTHDVLFEKEPIYKKTTIAFPENVLITLQKKQLEILNFIASCGETGCKNEIGRAHV